MSEYSEAAPAKTLSAPSTTSRFGNPLRSALAWHRSASPYSIALLIAGVATIVLFALKLSRPPPQLTYSHLLVSYEFGFMRRALIGEILSWFKTKIDPSDVFVLGTAMWLVALGLYVALLRRLQLPSVKSWAIFLCFTLGSPLFLKNFGQTLGYFDVHGAIALMIVLLLPFGIASIAIAFALSVTLLLIHHIHALLYIPAIWVCLGFQAIAARVPLPRVLFVGGALLAALVVIFGLVMFEGRLAIPVADLYASMQARATIDLSGDLPWRWAWMWISTLDQEIVATAVTFPKNAARFPLYFAVVLLHWPLIAYVRAYARGLDPTYRRAFIWGLALVSVAYVLVFVVASDYARWVASWATCMLLCGHAARQAFGPVTPMPDFDATSRWTLACAVILALIPRLGTTFPF